MELVTEEEVVYQRELLEQLTQVAVEVVDSLVVLQVDQE